MKKEIYITCGDCCNKHLSAATNVLCVPFNEALIEGNPKPPLFSPEFIEKRCEILKTTPQIYYQKMSGLFSFMKNPQAFNSVTLFFGTDDFCKYNLWGMLWLLQQIKFKGKINLNIIDEKTYDILESYKNIDVNQHLEKLDSFCIPIA